MKDKLNHLMKPAPERFRYALRQSVEEAVARSLPGKKRLSKGLRIVIAVALIAAIVPSAVFGASKLYGLFVQPKDHYGLAIGKENTETPSEYPQYVKMHVKIPEGFGVVPNTDELKYYSLSSEEPYTDGFSLNPMRFPDNADMKEVIGGVNSYEERLMDGHPAYEVRMDDGWDRLYVYFGDVNVFLLIYHKDVTDAQLADFVKGITFTEGTAEDYTFLDTPYDEKQTTAGEGYAYDTEIIEFPRDTKLSYEEESDTEGDRSLRYTAQITGVRTVTDIRGLDKDGFNALYDLDKVADSDGNLLPRTVTVTRFGDRFHTKDEVLSTEEAEQVLVLADITYENLGDKDIAVYIPWVMETYQKNDDGSYTQAEIIDEKQNIFANDYSDGEIFYLSAHGEGKSFYSIPNLPARGTATVTVGFRCNADKLDQAYLVLYGADGVADPVYNGNNPYHNYIFKVQ